jgi:hypothetical protein
MILTMSSGQKLPLRPRKVFCRCRTARDGRCGAEDVEVFGVGAVHGKPVKARDAWRPSSLIAGAHGEELHGSRAKFSFGEAFTLASMSSRPSWRGRQ